MAKRGAAVILSDQFTYAAVPPWAIYLHTHIITVELSDLCLCQNRDVVGILLWKGTKEKVWGRKSPSGVLQRDPAGSGASSPAHITVKNTTEENS